MNHARLSASGGDRARACPASFALPATPDAGSVHADRGTAIHAYLADIASGESRDNALARVAPEYREACAWINCDEVPRGDAEIAYAYNVKTDTARRFGRIEHRAYPVLADGEIPLTIDLWYRDGEITVVRDWKTGHAPPPPAGSSMQLALGALAVARFEGLSTIAVEMCRVGETGELTPERAMLDAWALDDAADEWGTIHAAVERARDAYALDSRLKVNPGEHCAYCPAKGACPAYSADAAIVVAPDANWLAKFEAAIADDAGAAEWWVKVARAEEIVATMRATIESRAAKRPFALPDGRTVREVSTTRDRVTDADAAYRTLVDLYGADVADKACPSERSTTKAKLEAVAGKGKENADAKRKLLRVLAERGAIATSTSTKVDATK